MRSTNQMPDNRLPFPPALEAHLTQIIGSLSDRDEKFKWILFRTFLSRNGVTERDLPVVRAIIEQLDVMGRNAFSARYNPRPPTAPRREPAGTPPPRPSTDIAAEIFCGFMFCAAFCYGRCTRLYALLPEWRVVLACLGHVFQRAVIWSLAGVAIGVFALVCYTLYFFISGVDLVYAWGFVQGLPDMGLYWAVQAHQVVFGMAASIHAFLGLGMSGIHAFLGLGMSGLYDALTGWEWPSPPFFASVQRGDERPAPLQSRTGFHIGDSPLDLSRKAGIHASHRARMPLSAYKIAVTLRKHGARLGSLGSELVNQSAQIVVLRQARDDQAAELAVIQRENAGQAAKLALIQRENAGLGAELAVIQRENAGQAAKLAVIQRENAGQAVEIAQLGELLSTLTRRLAEQERRLAEHDKLWMVRAGVEQGAFLLGGAAAIIGGAATGGATVIGTVGYWMMARMGLDFVATLVCEFGALHVLLE